ncbi:hypothetical protein [Roseovarius arcticus]|uniref:hypothetical protein n=1 Tax=Roseovarius arcticus TaxID=2547404 RepID=UPI001110A16A|nr:hypothetical protein [Roseovarius arcticus]
MLRSLSMTTAAILLGTAALAEPLVRFDVAEDHTRFVFQSAPVDDEGMPTHGNPFVTQGYVYPADTLAPGIDGVNEDGSPAFPELVLGTWTCDGFLVGAAMKAETGVFLVSRQTVVLNEGDILISHGPEIIDENVVQLRAISGATGSFVDHDGDIGQVFLGWGPYMGLRAAFDMEGHGEDS